MLTHQDDLIRRVRVVKANHFKIRQLSNYYWSNRIGRHAILPAQENDSHLQISFDWQLVNFKRAYALKIVC